VFGPMSTQLAYTLLDAKFREAFTTGSGSVVTAGNRLPGAPKHSLFAQLEVRPAEGLTTAVEMRAESKVYADDLNSDAAPGYAVFNLRAGQEFRTGSTKWHLFARLDNAFDRNYAGSVIVNDGNRRFFEPAAGRRLFVGLRVAM
jgi:iron complex outermembrane recepter protein